MVHIEGGCLCGKVRYSADTEPVFVGVCHCTDCQRFTGSAFATVIGVPAPALNVTGELKTFTKPGDTGKPIHRRFCSECGSGIMDEADALSGIVMLNAGTLDDRSWGTLAFRFVANRTPSRIAAVDWQMLIVRAGDHGIGQWNDAVESHRRGDTARLRAHRRVGGIARLPGAQDGKRQQAAEDIAHQASM